MLTASDDKSIKVHPITLLPIFHRDYIIFDAFFSLSGMDCEQTKVSVHIERPQQLGSGCKVQSRWSSDCVVQ